MARKVIKLTKPALVVHHPLITMAAHNRARQARTNMLRMRRALQVIEGRVVDLYR